MSLLGMFWMIGLNPYQERTITYQERTYLLSCAKYYLNGGETSINKWRIGFNMLQLNGAKWRKKRLGENRKDWILGAPVCPSLRFSGWILNEESSLSLSPWHRGWSHSWHSGVLTEVALWGVYSCRSTGRGHLYYCCFPARRYLPPPTPTPC